MTEQVTRPLVRYFGGKWRLAPWIVAQFPPHRVYVEPFGGGGSVLLRKPRSYAEVYNDMDEEMVNLFRVARDRGEELVRALKLTAFARREFYLACNFDAVCPLERARRTVVRSFMGFGSNAIHAISTGFRSNCNRSGTTPAMDWRNYPDALVGIVERLRGVVIECRDAWEVMTAHDGSDTLYYLDPPYIGEERASAGKHMYRHEMTEQEHEALLGALTALEGMVVISGYRNPLYDDLLSDWKRVERDAYAGGARKRTEVLWINRALSERDEFFGKLSG